MEVIERNPIIKMTEKEAEAVSEFVTRLSDTAIRRAAGWEELLGSLVYTNITHGWHGEYFDIEIVKESEVVKRAR